MATSAAPLVDLIPSLSRWSGGLKCVVVHGGLGASTITATLSGATSLATNVEASDVLSAVQSPARDLVAALLLALAREPLLDDEELADRVGISTFEASVTLREMERERLILRR